MSLPLIAPIHQNCSHPKVTDIAGEVRRQWQASSLPKRLKRGNRVAVAVGSRGIANLATMARATIEFLRDLGTQPFVVAAMGSHGGGTAEGQRELLSEYGVTEKALGVPVKTDMTTVVLGTNNWGEPVYWDRNAFESDAVVTISRVKPHTDFQARHESGIVKMLVIGLGKRDGAARHHRWGIRGLREMMPDSGRFIVEKTKFVAGLAVLENARDETALLKAVEKEKLFDEEPALLDQARKWMPRLPFEQLDVLVIGELGKNYSGAGIDPNVVGRRLVEGEPEFASPRITRMCVLDMAPESHGNATGVGIADLTTDRLIAKIDAVPFRLNNMTSCCLWRSKIPFAFPTDRECIEASIQTCWQPEAGKVRMAFIPNTLELTELWVTQPLADEARNLTDVKTDSDARPIPFDSVGTLQQTTMFPKCWRARANSPAR
jgi:hypothetical protein